VNSGSATMVVNAPFWEHWQLERPCAAGAQTVYLWHNAGIREDEIVTIGPNLGGTGSMEDLYVTSVGVEGTADYYVRVSKNQDGTGGGTMYAHSALETLARKATVVGVTLNSCSVVRSGGDYQVLAHELLHQVLLGRLGHVVDESNLMYPTPGTTLRYRRLDLYESSGWQASQWDDLHQ
jgi:hypothetical protein